MQTVKTSDTNELISHRNRLTDLETELLVAGGKDGGRESGLGRLTLLFLRWVTNRSDGRAQGTMVSALRQPGCEQNSGAGWMDMWSSPFTAHLELSQPWSSAMLQDSVKSLKMNK